MKQYFQNGNHYVLVAEKFTETTVFYLTYGSDNVAVARIDYAGCVVQLPAKWYKENGYVSSSAAVYEAARMKALEQLLTGHLV